MLLRLSVRDLALIEDLELELGSGLNVVTGETGAGKSLLHRAIAIALGHRAGSDTIRTGREEASVEAEFSSPSGRGALLPGSQPASIRVRRSIARAGRGQVLINGQGASLARLAELGGELAQLQGQHESLRLARGDAHAALLDSAAGTEERATEYHEGYARVLGLIAELDELEKGAAEVERRLGVARYDLEELEKAGIREGDEEERLLAERSRLRNFERLARVCGLALAQLYTEEGAALAALQRHARALTELAAVDPTLDPVAQGLEQATQPLADATRELEAYVDALEADPGRLEQVEERLALVERLERKHGVGDLPGLIQKRDELTIEIERASRYVTDPAALHDELEDAALRVWEVAEALAEERRAGAARLEEGMRSELALLGMPEGRFAVGFESLAPGLLRGRSEVLARSGRALGPDGLERVGFQLAANPGEGPRPLGRVASGGELSRLMLALHSLAGRGGTPTLVFDEVDAGIGGATAELVGRRLRDLARHGQVICITHLAQIAAYADRHYAVGKSHGGGRTRSSVRLVDGEERIAELARMLGGDRAAEPALDHAREILRRSREDVAGASSRPAPRARAARRGS